MNYYSHGKLLITGEYLIIKGALALAAPVRFGQEMQIEVNSSDKYLKWESFELDRCWFHAIFDTAFIKIIKTSDSEVANRLLLWLMAADQLNPGFLKRQKFKKVIVKSDFNLSWGLGSSSSLLSDIALWAEVDSFRLHKLLSKGSGYDVVCSHAEGPIFFTRKDEDYTIKKADFFPAFANRVYFIYLGRKQDSSLSVEAFLEDKSSFAKEIENVSELSNRIASAKSIDEFEMDIKEHEEIISNLLHRKRIKEERFSELKGEIKSLGAWGGDFAMLTWHDTLKELKKYLATKNIDTIFTFKEIIKTN
jgi:mevalonate kinase